MIPGEYSFPRYLEAKKSVDDRSLNRSVWEALASSLPENSSEQPTKVYEIGAGIGTMLARMMENIGISNDDFDEDFFDEFF